jgi:enoyl-CoA hydratase
MNQVRHRIEDKVGIIEFDNPPHQFMTVQMLRELDALTERWEGDDGVRAIVLTGARPGTFITHFDPNELSGSTGSVTSDQLSAPLEWALPGLFSGISGALHLLEHVPSLRRSLEAHSRDPGLEMLLTMQQLHRIFTRLELMDKAVIAAISGTAMGGGCELVLTCDYRLMVRGDYAIGLVEVLVGIIPGAGATHRLVATVGRAKAVEMILDGAVLNADEAERCGLVTRALDAEQLMPEAIKLARRLATRPLGAVGHAKRAARIGTCLPMDESLAFERRGMMLCGVSAAAAARAQHYLTRFEAGDSPRQIFDGLRQRGIPGVD